MQNPKILNVEDDAAARFLKSRILERAGFEVVEAEGATDAITRAIESDPKLVLLDLRLRDGDGFQVCEAIKARHPDLPVIMITSTYSTAQGRQDGLAAGADAYLIEPVSPDRLVRIISQFLAEPALLASNAVQAWIVTDDAGMILEISAPAHRLLNLSARGALGRNLTAFFSQERHRVVSDLGRAADGQIVQRDTVLRPRDRRPVRVRVEIAREKDALVRTPRLRWVIEPEMPNVQH